MSQYQDQNGKDMHEAVVLPSPDTTRWVISRKAQVVRAVEVGVLSVAEACQRYSLSEEEFDSWRALMREHGVRGLRVTKVQDYRLADSETNESPAATKKQAPSDPSRMVMAV